MKRLNRQHSFDNKNSATCVGCGCTDNNACVNEYHDTCYWLKVNRQSGLGVCSFCTEFLSHPLTDDDGEAV
ncbi:hypothetical protein E0I83_02040 [Salmonella enterica subsp. enterica serovar Stanley]|nr:hypothetical protein [Salmonella enterica subsp. enterica serovar Weltevreden]EBA6874632.1 hypothetical protein [Salmonella enterica]EBW7865066.1 hypothetical protein [Salmonella enterica subsp. enterica serovar Newport]ECE0588283.1 hypothetical protein [Salmonella enterica subsp. enterica]ECG4683701.1 hypothetical protein [Salmonella enterica subsp. enterica serovar Stanley]ECH8301232.1 hypothetical protein [Salmonella enterica subsp. enterica serovar Lexington]EDB5948964.1 hypothetical p